MASRAVEDLAGAPGVERVTIADWNVGAAREIAAGLGDQPAMVDVRQVDARDHAALVEAMRGYDVAASGLGPFYLYEPPLVRAALEAGVDYASICDEWQAARTVLDDLDAPAREKGVTVITGLGTSPGISNVGVAYLSAGMDTVKRAHVYVYQPLDAGGGEAVVRHMLHIISGQVAVWREGKSQMVPACSEEQLVEFPRFGPIKVWNMGHSEPETLPRTMPDLEEASFYMGFGSGSNLFIRPARWGLFKRPAILNAVARFFTWLEQATSSGDPELGAVRVDVWGIEAGAEVHRMACGIGQMREVTGLSLSIGAQMLARKDLLVDAGGVYAPEACLEPGAFLTALREKGMQAYTDLAMAEPIV
jgi:saccharopine dehydrogenase-like NADP-dependent oxidoreductase